MFETTSISGLIELGLDDRESAFWVLFWVVLRYTKHNLSPAKLAKRLKMFDEADWECGESSGGDEKAHVLRQARPFENIQLQNAPPYPNFFRISSVSSPFATRKNLPLITEASKIPP